MNVSNESVEGSAVYVRFDSYDSVVEVDPFSQPERFVNVPWFERFYWRSSELVNQHFRAGILSGCVPVRALKFPDWDFHFVIPSDDLL